MNNNVNFCFVNIFIRNGRNVFARLKGRVGIFNVKYTTGGYVAIDDDRLKTIFVKEEDVESLELLKGDRNKME